VEIVRRVQAMREVSRQARGRKLKIGFVPTLGALHEGHLSLIRKVDDLADVVVVSVFVNPTQFGPEEDFEQYPRDLTRDVDLCIAEGVDYLFTPEVHERIMREVIEPTVAGMAADGYPYQGFLYAGLMITPEGAPKVIEFNCRFGDPEAQPVMMRLRSDLVELCRRALAGDLAQVTLEWDPRVALGVVMAAGGYPDDYRKGDVIHGLEDADADGLKVFHAGTVLAGGNVVTNGGRVLCVVGLGADVAAAQQRAYQGVARIGWHDHYFRRDIGHRAIGRR